MLAIIGEALFLEGRPYEAVPLMRQAYDALNGQPPSVELAELAAQLGRMQGLAGLGDRAPSRWSGRSSSPSGCGCRPCSRTR